MENVVRFVKSRHTIYETPITMPADGTVGEALSLIYKRAHGAVVVVDGDGRPSGGVQRSAVVGGVAGEVGVCDCQRANTVHQHRCVHRKLLELDRFIQDVGNAISCSASAHNV